MANRLNITYMLSAFLALSVATADDSMQMYEKNAAKTVFGKDVVVQVAKFEDPKEIKKEDPAQLPAENINTPADGSADAILAKYGDPLKKFEIKPKDDAPKPFQAMIEALKIGDKELAYKYAIQYTRYMQELESINNEVVGVQGKAMEKLGIVPKGGWTSSKEYEEYNSLLELPITEEEATKMPEKRLEKSAKDLLKLAQSENDLFYKAENATPKVDVNAEKALARKELAGLLPVAPKGAVDVYFFFSARSNDSILQGRELQKLQKTMFVEHEVNLIGLDVQGEDPIREEEFRKETGATYNIVSGKQFSQMLGVETVPAVGFVNRQTGKTYVIRDYKSSVYLAEALLMIEEAGKNA